MARLDGTMSEDLYPEIGRAYDTLAQAKAELIEAEADLELYERELRVNHAEAILEAKNERTASVYLDGLRDHDGYRQKERRRREAEASYFAAKCAADSVNVRVKLIAALGSPREVSA